MEYRFAVGSQIGPRSDSWIVWSHRGQVYLAQRSMGHVHKFSFHRGHDIHKGVDSEISKWALVRKPPDGSNPVMKEARPGPVPPAGNYRASLLAAVIFPTNHLSTACPDKPDKPSRVQWIDPAPAGMATVVEVSLTNDDRPAIEAGFARGGLRTLQTFWPLRDGPNVIVATLHFDCGPVECRVPRDPVIPGQVFGELVFPDADPQDQGRPVRTVLTEHSGERFELWELGGYEIEPIAA